VFTIGSWLQRETNPEILSSPCERHYSAYVTIAKNSKVIPETRFAHDVIALDLKLELEFQRNDLMIGCFTLRIFLRIKIL